LSANDGRTFGLTVGGAFLVLTALLVWRQKTIAPYVLGALGTALVLLGVVAPTRLEPVERAWMRLATAISKVTTPIVMSIVYFVVLTPMALLRRTLGKNAIVHVPVNGSLWIPRETTRSDLARQF
jgi:hypothetical protein